ncbi:hypothetical protein ACIBJF_52710, partial [Streptomyces sp. NPDC050743]|uniref:hypothetical protein n=1 Tax=Streptomyces sp. NPDC050743 TaxID=3365634 RepID=UPI003793867B
DAEARRSTTPSQASPHSTTLSSTSGKRSTPREAAVSCPHYVMALSVDVFADPVRLNRTKP